MSPFCWYVSLAGLVVAARLLYWGLIEAPQGWLTDDLLDLYDRLTRSKRHPGP
uniref:Uncharacterized protein n=1 Tax=Caulobacter phage BL57 TaxID=3348355 RepID=A0AB74UK83_9VIRU